jgi:putative ubiquitin-RnfH superfamily antitoxin RatB of RatAB toxin-antitoxin module
MVCAEVPPAMLRVELACSPAPRAVQLVQVLLPAGATVRDALQAGLTTGLAGLAAAAAIGDAGALTLGIWGRVAALDDPLHDGDRVEVYRGLKVDPKEARRLRYRAQGERGRAPRGKAGGRAA